MYTSISKCIDPLFIFLYIYFRFWLGIELDHPRGTCDGTKGGKEYFKCQPNHGIFVLPSKVSKIIGKDSIDLPSSGGSCSPSPNPPVSTPSNTRRRRLTPNSAR